MIQYRKWLVGFGLSGEIVVWDQGDEVWDGEDGDSPYPLGVFPPAMPLDWVWDCDKDEDSSLALLDVSDEYFLWKVKAACPKNRGSGELLNLEMVRHAPPLNEGKARLMCCSV